MSSGKQKSDDDNREKNIDKETVRKYLREILKDLAWNAFVMAVLTLAAFLTGYNYALYVMS